MTNLIPIELELYMAQQHSIMTELLAVTRMAVNDSDDIRKKTEMDMAVAATLFASSLTPVRSGSLATSHEVIQTHETYVHISLSAVNPFSPENPAEYGPDIHAMGGTSRSGHIRAFYDQTIIEHGEEILDIGEESLVNTLQVFT